MNRILLSFLGLFSAFSLNAQTPYLFSRTDTVTVTFLSDTLDLAWAGGINYAQFSNIDLNMDGQQDLFVFDRTGNKPLTFLHTGGTGTVTYTYSPDYEVFFPAMQNWALMRDFNGDGKADLFTHTPGGFKVYRNTSSSGSALSFVVEKTLLRSNQLGNFVNLYVSSVDVPGLEDIDNDGDLDILTFGVFGTTMEYHRNYSVENGHGLDSLQFTMMNQCWGCFAEDQSSNNVYLNDTCDNIGISNPQLPLLIEDAIAGELEYTKSKEILDIAPRHTGSSICVIDADGNGVKDLLLGDVSFSNVALTINGGDVPNTASCMDSVDANFPSYGTPVSQDLFPGSFFVDVNNDGKRDLIFSPQTTGLSENAKSVAYYYNSNYDSLPYFNFVSNNLLQSEMIERGEGATPVFFDYDGDGLKDLFVANFGLFNSVTDSYVSKVSLYRNNGSISAPSFTLVTENFESLDAVIGLNNLIPAFGDLDGDGDADMVVGNEQGTLSFFENIAGAGNTADFSMGLAGMLDDQGVPIDAGQFSAPFLADLDRDGDNDLIIGNKTGKLVYYKNISTSGNYLFRLETNFLGSVNVKEWWDNSGYSIPWVIEDSSQFQLFIGSKSGFVHHYNNIDGNLTGTFNRVDSTVIEVPSGIRSAPCLADLNNDGLLEMIVGNYRGGLTFYQGDINGTSSIPELAKVPLFNVFPNPTGDHFRLVATSGNLNGRLLITDAQGRMVVDRSVNGSDFIIHVNDWTEGIYFAVFTNENQRYAERIIVFRD